MEKRRSPLVSIPALRAGIFKAWGSIVRWPFPRNAQCERIGSRAAEHRLDEPAGIPSLGMVASLQCPLPFRPARSIVAPQRPAVSQYPFRPGIPPDTKKAPGLETAPVGHLAVLSFRKQSQRERYETYAPRCWRWFGCHVRRCRVSVKRLIAVRLTKLKHWPEWKSANKWGFIDKTGKMVIPARFEGALDFFRRASFCHGRRKSRVHRQNGKDGHPPAVRGCPLFLRTTGYG